MIHPTSIVHPEAQIDPSVEIGPWCTVGPHVKIGKNNRLISHVVMDGWTEIGENNVFFPFAVIGAIPQDLKYKGEPTKLIIGNENTIREAVTLNLGTVQGGGVTRLGNKNLLMAYTHLGHDCLVGNQCIIANGAGLAGHVVIEDFVTIGGMTGVTQFVRVGSYAYIAGQSGLERDVPPYSIAIGSRPANLKGANIVGLRRRGFPSDIIQKINEAIKLWIRPDVQKEQCLLEIESQYGEFPEIQKFVSFIRESDTGVVR
ncbi:MAG: acyl-[acyl-carrier-protein]--UDP-N-acetylglucosamine O-acyltransferase [Bdellovibrionales bacterium GWB1_55_8]|nr:MAG: acyl-[acyl-carrier-protein]--UDP-N-acetylglucosamine O-acyltransferase [Bdellovibrionales bacterium GWB1_55_8]